MKKSLRTKLALLSLVSAMTISSVMALSAGDYVSGGAVVDKVDNTTTKRRRL